MSLLEVDVGEIIWRWLFREAVAIAFHIVPFSHTGGSSQYCRLDCLQFCFLRCQCWTAETSISYVKIYNNAISNDFPLNTH